MDYFEHVVSSTHGSLGTVIDAPQIPSRCPLDIILMSIFDQKLSSYTLKFDVKKQQVVGS